MKNKELNYIIPMAGNGSRFLTQGYQLPKYMLTARGKSLFEWSILSMPLEIGAKIIFIALNDHEKSFKVTQFIEEKITLINKQLNITSSYDIILLDAVTRGQAETVLYAKKLVDQTAQLAIFNIDTHFHSASLAKILLDDKLLHDGVIGAFSNPIRDAKWSYAKVNKEGIVSETAEKVAISDYALTGFYHFSKADDFFSTAESQINSNEKSCGEFYIAPMYNKLISQGRKFVIDVAEYIIPLGTPEDLETYAAK